MNKTLLGMFVLASLILYSYIGEHIIKILIVVGVGFIVYNLNIHTKIYKSLSSLFGIHKQNKDLMNKKIRFFRQFRKNLKSDNEI